MKKKSYTEKMIKSNNLFLIITIFASFIVDSLMFVSILLKGFSVLYWIAPLVLMAVDVIFVLKCFITNFRFRYSVGEFITYLLSFFVASCAVAYLFDNPLISKNTAQTYLAGIAFIASHALTMLVSILTVLHARGVKFWKKQPLMIGICSILVVAICGYSFLLLTQGFFGQGNKHAVLTNYYEYDSDTDTYVVTSYYGKGDTVVIPASFNNKEISAVQILAKKYDNGVISDYFIENTEKTISIQYDTSIDRDPLLENVSIHVDKNLLASYQSDILEEYSFTTQRDYLFNRFIPDHLESDEVFVSYAYSSETLDLLSSMGKETEILPVWVGKKGETFDVSYANIDYAIYSKNQNEDNLCLSYKNYQKYAMKPLCDANNRLIDGKVIQNNLVRVPVTFEPVYRLSFLADNDTLYEEAHYPYLNDDNTLEKNRYCLKDDLQTMLDNYPRREGFDLAFKLNRTTLTTDLVDYVEQNALSNDLSLQPIWELKAPTIDSIFSSVTPSITYGDSITFTPNVTGYMPGFDYIYEWSFINEKLQSTQEDTYSIENALPVQSGSYQVKIYVSSQTVTSLKATSLTKSVTLTVHRKNLSFDWSYDSTEGIEYNANYQTIPVSYKASDVINDDEITYDVSYSTGESGVKNAGNYTATVELTGTAKDLYQVTLASKNLAVTVKPHALSILWGSTTEFTYNGEEQAPGYTLTNDLGESLIYSETKEINAGDHIAKVSLTMDDASNYQITNPTMAYTILKKKINSLTWNTPLEFTYNLEEQYPTIQKSSDILSQDLSSVLADLNNHREFLKDGVKIAQSIHAGEYLVIYSLSSNSNYQMMDNIGEKSYTILQKKVKLEYDSDVTYTYNGEEHVVHASNILPNSTLDNLEAEEINVITKELQYQNETKVNAGSYSLSVSLPNTSDYELVSGNTFVYTILPYSISVQWDTTEFTYNSQPQAPEIVREKLYQDTIFNYSYKASGGTILGAPIHYGSYTVTVSTDDSNFEIAPSSETNFEIKKKTLTNATLSKVTMTYNGTVQKPSINNMTGLLASDKDAVLQKITMKVTTSKITVNDTVTKEADSLHAGRYYVALAIEDCDYTIGEFTVGYTIYKITLRSVSSSETNLVYNGANQTPKLDGADGLLEMDKERILGLFETTIHVGTTTVSESIHAGSYELTFALPDDCDYQISQNTVLVYFIAQKKLTITEVSKTTFTYNKEEQVPTIKTIEGFVGTDKLANEKITYQVTYFGKEVEAINAGSYTVQYSTSNTSDYYFGADSISFTITPLAVTLLYDKDTYVYNGFSQTVKANSVKATDSSVTLTEEEIALILQNVQYENNTAKDANLDGYTMNASLKEDFTNYELSAGQSFVFTIAPYPIDCKWNFTTFEYLGSGQAPVIVPEDIYKSVKFTYTYKKGGIELSEMPIDCGTYQVTAATEDKNFTIGMNKTMNFTITKLVLTKDDVLINAISFEYDGEKHTPTITGCMKVYERDNTVTVAKIQSVVVDSNYQPCDAINAGQYYLKCTLEDTNYEFSSGVAYVPFKITKKVITAVNAKDTYFTYNGETQNPEIISVTGAIEGEENLVISYLQGKITVVSGGTSDSCGAGSYIISYTLKENPNYSIGNSIKLQYFINKKEITLNYVDESRSYNGCVYTVMANSIEGVYASDVDTVASELQYANNVQTNAGKYTLTVTLKSTSNYQIAEGNSYTFEITPYALNPTFDTVSFIYDGAAHQPKVNNLPDFFADAILTYTVYKADDSSVSVNAIAVGSYVLKISTSSSNLTLEKNEVTFEIENGVKSQHRILFISKKEGEANDL